MAVPSASLSGLSEPGAAAGSTPGAPGELRAFAGLAAPAHSHGPAGAPGKASAPRPARPAPPALPQPRPGGTPARPSPGPAQGGGRARRRPQARRSHGGGPGAGSPLGAAVPRAVVVAAAGGSHLVAGHVCGGGRGPEVPGSLGAAGSLRARLLHQRRAPAPPRACARPPRRLARLAAFPRCARAGRRRQR